MIDKDNKFIKVAKILAPHGIKGDIKLYISEDFNDLFGEKGVKFFLIQDDNPVEIQIRLNSKAAKGSIAKIDIINTRNDSESLKGSYIYVDRNYLPDFNENEFLHSDLVGLSVFVEDKEYGKIIDIHNFGAGDIIEIEKINSEREYIPFQKEFFENISKNKIMIKIPEFI